jgi:phage N-6-adenine-methyltransferase
MLTIIEQTELAQQEQIIERGLQTFYEVGEALAKIREGKLYRSEYGTFEDYLEQRWNISKMHAYRLMEASTIHNNLKSNQLVTLPTTESQTRPLAQLESEYQAHVWQQAVATAPNGKPTSAHVTSVVQAFRATLPQIENEDFTVETEESFFGGIDQETGEIITPTTVQPQPMQLLTSSKNDSWRTPQIYIDAAKQVMDGIDLDPATSLEANRTIKATFIFTKEDNALAHDWHGRVWLNPPYGKTNNKSNQGLFADKLLAEYRQDKVSEAILLVNLYWSYDWFAPLRSLPMCIPDNRIAFINPDTGEEGDEAKATSVFIYVGKDPDCFFNVFSQFGYCVQPFRR